MATPKLVTRDTSPIQVFARATGKLHWLCPACHYIHNATLLNFRRPRIVCDGKWFGLTPCNKVFRLGFVFDSGLNHCGEHAEYDDACHVCYDLQYGTNRLVPPFNALLATPLEVFSTNRLGRSALAGYTPAIAHVNGQLEYRCPTCDDWNRQRIDFTGAVQCVGCHQPWRVGVLFHPPTPRTHRLHCPRDWSVTREQI